MSLNAIAKEVYETSREKGWHDSPRETGTIHMLIVSEIAEATEAARMSQEPMWYTREGKPEGEAVELADAVIRIMDYFASKGWNLDHVINEKIAYNKTRSYRHGGKKF